ncbi:MAG: hypothetical protein ACYTBS_17370 [Planctomycetota bacterium]|jgi:hypothetical protein
MTGPAKLNLSPNQAETYEICVEGHLQDRWREWFEDLSLTREDDGTTTLSGPLPDQTALHSVLLKIRNMNLKLLSVRHVEPRSHAE